MENPIFVVGLPRSGSTLWENILARSPEIFRLAEVLFLTPWRRDFKYFIRTRIGDLSIEKNIKKMIEIIFTPHDIIPGITGSFWRFENIKAFNKDELKEEIYHKILRSDKSLGSIFKILIEEITRYNGYRRCCVAFPVYSNHVPKLLQWYPRCKIIHVTRDPRAIAISKTNDPGGTAKIIKKYPHLGFIIRKIIISFVIVQYIWTSKLHCKYKAIDNYTLFRYEDLLVEPEMKIKELCEFTEIDFMPQMIDPKKELSSSSSITGKQSKGFNKKAASHWKKVITNIEEKIITLLTKSRMKRFEYDPDNHPVYFNNYKKTVHTT